MITTIFLLLRHLSVIKVWCINLGPNHLEMKKLKLILVTVLIVLIIKNNLSRKFWIGWEEHSGISTSVLPSRFYLSESWFSFSLPFSTLTELIRKLRHYPNNQWQGNICMDSGMILVDSLDKGVTTKVHFWGIYLEDRL